MTPNIPLTAWVPDADPTIPGVLTDVENLVPTLRGYASEFQLGTGTLAPGVSLPGGIACGAGLVSFASYTALPVIGAQTDIYVVSASSAVSVKRTTTPYNAASPTAPWRFDSFGDKLLAVQYNNVLQISSTTPTSALQNVVNAPSAATIATNKNFVLLGAYTTGVTTTFDGWICSALDDPTDWTPDIATQCASGRLTATSGPIVRLIAFGDYVIALKARGVYRGTYVGAADNTWSWPLISSEIGLAGHDAICEAEGVLYWLGGDGVYRYAGGAIQRIPSAPWDWLIRYLGNQGYVGQQTSCIWDSVCRVVRWLIQIPGSTDKLCLTYHTDTDRWGKSVMGVQVAYRHTVEFVRMRDKVGVVGVEFAPAYIATNGAIQTQSSESAFASSFTTGDIGDDDQAFALTRARARFLTAPTSSTATHYHRMNLGDALTTGATVSRNDGKYDISHAARWHRLKFSQTGNHEVTGYSVETPTAGRR